MSLRRPAIGEAAPRITLDDPAGRPWRLEDQLDSPQVLIFHRHIH